MEKERLSCVDCGAVFCARGGDNYPKFCPTAKMQEEEKKELSERLITLQNNNKTIFLKEEKYLDELLKQTDNIVKKLKIANNLNVQEQIKEIEKFDQIIEMMKSNVYKCHAN